jgi:hypothetical protein
MDAKGKREKKKRAEEKAVEQRFRPEAAAP